MNAIEFGVIRYTRNYDQMLHFYRDVLGMKLVTRWERTGSRGALLSPGERMGKTVIEILEFEGGSPVQDSPPANVALNIEVDDARSWYQKVAAADVAVAQDPETTLWGNLTFGINDPDGLRIWLYQVMS